MKKMAVLILIAVLVYMGLVNPVQAGETMDSSLSALTTQIVSGLPQGVKYKVAVMEFPAVDGRKSELGGFIAEELVTRLFKTKRVLVVERQLLNKVLEEQKLNLVGIIDETTAMKIGKIVGADAICAGTITDLGESLKINARLISSESGAILAVASSEMNKDERVLSLMSQTKKRPSGTAGASSRRNNLVYNGDFAQRYEGWERRIGDITQGSSKTEIMPYANGASGQALHIRHEGNGFVQFSQVVDVPSHDLIFSATFQASSHEGMIMGFTGTGIAQIALQYIGENDNLIGQTVLLNYVKNPFADTPLIGVPKLKSDTYKSRSIAFGQKRLYTNYRIDIQKELEENLLGVDAGSLRKIGIVIWCGASHSQAGSELWITDVSLKSK